MSRDAVKDAMLHHTIDNEALADALIRYTTQLFIRGVAEYLRSSGYTEAGNFLDQDVKRTLTAIDAMNPQYLTDD
jgi:hypothetical protein